MPVPPGPCPHPPTLLPAPTSLLPMVAFSPPRPSPQDLGTTFQHPFPLAAYTPPPPHHVRTPLPHLQLLLAPHIPTCCCSCRVQRPCSRAACLPAAEQQLVYLPTFPPSHPGAPWLRSSGHLSWGPLGSNALPRAFWGAPGGKPFGTLSCLPGHHLPPHPTPTFLLSFTL